MQILFYILTNLNFLDFFFKQGNKYKQIQNLKLLQLQNLYGFILSSYISFAQQF